MELSTVARIVAAFYRLVGSKSSDGALVDQGEAVDDVVYQFLTDGSRRAQRWMLDMGYGGWRKRSAALSFTGTDAADGGRKVDLPSDFLRSFGTDRVSPLTEADGTRWGALIDDVRGTTIKGDYCYIRGDELWLARTAVLPSTVYLDYHFVHPEWSSVVTIDFPLEARRLIIAEAANAAKEENWLPGGRDLELKIERNLQRERERARHVSRTSKAPRQLTKAYRAGSRW